MNQSGWFLPSKRAALLLARIHFALVLEKARSSISYRCDSMAETDDCFRNIALFPKFLHWRSKIKKSKKRITYEIIFVYRHKRKLFSMHVEIVLHLVGKHHFETFNNSLTFVKFHLSNYRSIHMYTHTLFSNISIRFASGYIINKILFRVWINRVLNFHCSSFIFFRNCLSVW